ncbi:BTAD domain-containing putative transcriptional regulator [Trujillonella humicola]|uniref:BTAD domain-containing putative transcriptional regulator n=1 Tax=Trujillonella humicola TaxID=3383699 RepID=UPI0039061B0E
MTKRTATYARAAMRQLAFRVLGPVSATLDGIPLELGGWRQRSVLARLLVASGRVVPVEVLIGDLWHAATPPSAMSALQAHVSHLRRALEPDRPPRTPAQVLVTSPPGYALRPPPEAVDAALAVQLLDEGDRLAGTDPETARHRYTAALDLWQGPPYADYADEPWARPEAARLEELRLIAVERRAAAALAAPAGRDPVPLLRSHVAEHPLREEGWRLLALGLYRAGRQGDALAALREARDRLAEDLGTDPGPALRALEADVLSQAPSLDPVRLPAPPVGRSAPRPSPGPVAVPADAAGPGPVGGRGLVGRDAERTALHRAAAEAAGGSLRVAVVSGEAGSGKTALLDELTGRLAAEGWEVCPVRCPETDGAPPAWPWTQALGALAVAVPPEDPASVAPLLTDAPGTGGHGDAVGNRFRLHQAVGRWLAGVAAGAPLLLVVDDLHRADQETAALLVDLAAALAASPVLLVVGHRAEETARLTEVLAALARRSPLPLRLRGLDAADIDRLVDGWATAPVDAATRAAIAARTDGNPFYVRELLRLVGSGADVAEVPSSVRDVVRHRVGALPGTTASLLRLAAVCGRDVDADVLLAAAEGGSGDEEAAVDALETAVVSGLLVEPGPGRLRFVHALVRDTLYEDLSSLRRTRLHGRLAAVLERLRPDDVTGLAHHTAAAGPGAAAAALRWCQEAARLAERRFAHADAALWWQRAVAAARSAQPGDRAAVSRLLAAQARATALAGASGPARALRAEALAELPAGAAPGDVAGVLLSSDVPTFWNARVDPVDDAVVARLEATIAALGPTDPLRARLLAALATEFEERHEPRGPAASREAVRIARAAGDATTLAHALAARAVHTHRDSDGGERAAIGAELLQVARGAGLGAFETVARLVLLQDACGRMDFADADVQAAEAERLAEAQGLRLLLGIARCYRGLRHLLADRPGPAQAAYDDAVEELVAAGWYRDVGESFRVIGAFCLSLAAGVPDPGLPERVAAVFSAAPDDLREMWAAALVVAGRVEEARQVGPPRPRYGRDPFGPLFAYHRGLVGLGLGDDERVAEALAGLAPHADTLCGIESASVTTGPAATLLARLAAHRGDDAAAAAYQRQAIALAERLGHAGWTTAARQALG